MLIGRGQLINWSAKSIRWHLLNASFSINYSNIMSDNTCRKSGLRQPVTEAYSPKNLLIRRLLAKKRHKGWWTRPLWSVCNFRYVYLMLRLKTPPGVSLIRTALWICSRGKCMLSFQQTRCGSQRNSASACSKCNLGGRQSVFRCSGKLSNSV